MRGDLLGVLHLCNDQQITLHLKGHWLNNYPLENHDDIPWVIYCLTFFLIRPVEPTPSYSELWGHSKCMAQTCMFSVDTVFVTFQGNYPFFTRELWALVSPAMGNGMSLFGWCIPVFNTFTGDLSHKSQWASITLVWYCNQWCMITC